MTVFSRSEVYCAADKPWKDCHFLLWPSHENTFIYGAKESGTAAAPAVLGPPPRSLRAFLVVKRDQRRRWEVLDVRG